MEQEDNEIFYNHPMSDENAKLDIDHFDEEQQQETPIDNTYYYAVL